MQASSMRRTLLTFALSIGACLPANAQQLKLSFNDGRVSIDATSVPVRTILVEWGKLGGTKVIGGERVAGAPVTLKLENVPESQALEIVLRSVAGYMAAPRSAAAATGASMYDRILVMATSATPPAPAARPAGNAPNAGAAANQRFAPPRPSPADEDEPEEEDPNPPNPPVFSFPQPGQPGLAQPGMFPNAPPGGQPPAIMLNPNSGEPQSITINPATDPGVAPTFGSPRPGMINVPPPQPQPPRPGAMVRPPGGGA
jgi:hypothetical protein